MALDKKAQWGYNRVIRVGIALAHSAIVAVTRTEGTMGRFFGQIGNFPYYVAIGHGTRGPVRTSMIDANADATAWGSAFEVRGLLTAQAHRLMQADARIKKAA